MNRRVVAALLVAAGCVSTPAPTPTPSPVPVASPPAASPSGPAETLESFLRAVDARDFDRVHALLTPSLRDRYTAKRLADDFGAIEPHTVWRLEQIRIALAKHGLQQQPDDATVEWAPGRNVHLLREGTEWRVDSLDWATEGTSRSVQ